MEVPTEEVPCLTTGIFNLHCASHSHMLTKANSVVLLK